jgi:hypothetical protein
MNPELISCREIGNSSNGERYPVACDTYIDARADQIEAGVHRLNWKAAAQEEGQQQQSNAFTHAASLDARGSRRCLPIIV